MPYLKKLSPHSSRILPKIDNDLAFYGASYTSNSGNLTTSFAPGITYNMIVDSDGTQVLTSEPDSDSTEFSFSRPRKRQRLDHLSQEEKVMRRKLKNRVAAQSARDRKKARMTELEDQVSELESEKNMLTAENRKLKSKNIALVKENMELRERLGLVDIPCKKSQISIAGEDTLQEAGAVKNLKSVGHASLISGPLLQGQDLRILTLWMMQYVYLPAIARLTLFLIYYSSVAKTFYNATSLVPCRKVEKTAKNCQTLKWWGPHQKAWNPTKN